MLPRVWYGNWQKLGSKTKNGCQAFLVLHNKTITHSSTPPEPKVKLKWLCKYYYDGYAEKVTTTWKTGSFLGSPDLDSPYKFDAFCGHPQAIYRTAHMEPDICIWAWVRNISGPKEVDAALNLYLLKAEDNPDTSVSRSTLKPGIVSSKYLVSCPCPKKNILSTG